MWFKFVSSLAVFPLCGLHIRVELVLRETVDHCFEKVEMYLQPERLKKTWDASKTLASFIGLGIPLPHLWGFKDLSSLMENIWHGAGDIQPGELAQRQPHLLFRRVEHRPGDQGVGITVILPRRKVELVVQ